MGAKNKNIQDSIVFFIAGAALLCYSLVQHGDSGMEWKLSPYLFSLLISVFLILLSFSLFHEGLKELKQAAREGPREAAWAWKNVLAVALFSLAYYLVMHVIPFIPATVVFLGGLIFFLGERRWHFIAITALVSSLAIYGIFGVALGVRLP
jgi:hypothetical protein